MIRRAAALVLVGALLFGCVACQEKTACFGVIMGRAMLPGTIDDLTDLGAGWVRLNRQLDGDDVDLKPYLDAGLNLVVTFSNRDPNNVDETCCGTLADWPRAGFPYATTTQDGQDGRTAYQNRVRESLAAVIPYLASGTKLWVQCGNEMTDASVNQNATFWRGTTDQYLAQLEALFETVRSIDPSIPVVLTSFASGTLDIAIDPSDPMHGLVSSWMAGLLAAGKYDAADLHFYGCAEDIGAKVQWVKDHLPAGKLWISTENGGPDSRCPSTPLTWDRDPSLFEQIQAQQVPARLAACADNGGSVCLWFSLFDTLRESGAFQHLGLLDPTAPPARKKPAYGAFKSFVASRS